MNVTVRFADPLYFSIFSAALLSIGWGLGARWGYSATAAYAFFSAIILLIIHDIAMAVLAGICGYKVAMLVITRGERIADIGRGWMEPQQELRSSPRSPSNTYKNA
jgi:hypothetical protein